MDDERKTYLLLDIDVRDQEAFMSYVGQIPALIEKHGGKYLVQGAVPEAIHAVGTPPAHVVVLEFPAKNAATAFLAERSARGLADLFDRSAEHRLLLAEGTE